MKKIVGNLNASFNPVADFPTPVNLTGGQI